MKFKVLALAAVAASTAVLAIDTRTAQAEVIYGITGASAGSSLVWLDSSDPSLVTTVGALTGLPAGQSLRAIDFRPSDGKLYGLSTSGTSYTLLTIDLATAAATPVGSGTAAVAFPSRVSMDFSPANDHLRVITGGSANMRINPVSGSLLATDADVFYGAGDPNSGQNPPFIVGAAYASVAIGPMVFEELFTWDFNLDIMASSPNPTTGELVTVGGPPVFITFDGGVGMDFSANSGTMYLSYRDFAGVNEVLSTLDLSTGNVTPLGNFPVDMLDIAVSPTVIPEPASLSLLAAGLVAMARRARRA
jgi:hypothetical protein